MPIDDPATPHPLVHVRPCRPSDLPELLRMRKALWPDDDAAEDVAGLEAFLARPDSIVLVAERPDGGLAGFAELGTRPYADGCDTSPVAYLEGWYVDPDVRRQGVGAALVRAGEEWARARGLTELASDALLDDETSHRAHRAIGFAEVERAVKYRKVL